MRPLRLIAIATFLGAGCFAQVAEIGAFGGVSMLSNNGIGSMYGAGANDIKLENGFMLGFRITMNNKKFFGHEMGYAYNRANWNIASDGATYGSAIHQGFYDFLVYGTPEGAKIRPFAAGGAGFNTYVYPGYSGSSGGGSTKFGFNAGGGVKVKVAQNMLVRFDLRVNTTPKPFGFPGAEGWIKQTQASVGWSWTL